MKTKKPRYSDIEKETMLSLKLRLARAEERIACQREQLKHYEERLEKSREGVGFFRNEYITAKMELDRINRPLTKAHRWLLIKLLYGFNTK